MFLGTSILRAAPEAAQQSVCNGVSPTEAGRLPPDVPSIKPIRTVKIKRPPVTEFPSPDHDYSATKTPIRPESPSQPKPQSQPETPSQLKPKSDAVQTPVPVPANNNDFDLPHQMSSEPAVKDEDLPPAASKAKGRAKKTAKKAGEAAPKNKRAGQSQRSWSKTMTTHQYENKETTIIQKKGNNPKVCYSKLFWFQHAHIFTAEVRTVPGVRGLPGAGLRPL